MLTIQDMMAQVVQQGASDLHLIVGIPPMLRIHGVLSPIEGQPEISATEMEPLLAPLFSGEQKELLSVNKELDFSFQFSDNGRFRINIYYQKGLMSAAMRLIPAKILSIEDLGLPPICHEFTKLKQGLILVTGPTGHGKSTSLAAMIDEINRERAENILTIEDPIEFVYKPVKSIISQRELHADTHSWDIALRAALREDPDVVLVGEMRDYETIASALTVAETGHLVFATLHTNSAPQTIDRIIDVFPAMQQAQIRSQLALSLQAVMSQRLLPSLRGGRAVTVEIMVANSAVRNLIREGKAFQLDTAIQTGAEQGMISLENHLAYLIENGTISYEVGLEYSLKPDDLQKLVKKEHV